MERFITLQDFKIRVILKKRLKSLRLKLNPKTREVELHLPFLCPLKEAEAFAKKNLSWIEKTSKSFPALQRLKNGDKINLLGKSYTLCHVEKRTPTHSEGDLILVSGDNSFLHRRVLTFIKASLLEFLYEQKPFLEKEFKRERLVFSVKEMQSRWGSCSQKGHISISWRLALAPKEVLDYVLIHEASHLKEMNHSERFWALVGEKCPSFQKQRKWLKENGKSLYALQDC